MTKLADERRISPTCSAPRSKPRSRCSSKVATRAPRSGSGSTTLGYIREITATNHFNDGSTGVRHTILRNFRLRRADRSARSEHAERRSTRRARRRSPPRPPPRRRPRPHRRRPRRARFPRRRPRSYLRRRRQHRRPRRSYPSLHRRPRSRPNPDARAATECTMTEVELTPTRERRTGLRTCGGGRGCRGARGRRDPVARQPRRRRERFRQGCGPARHRRHRAHRGTSGDREHGCGRELRDQSRDTLDAPERRIAIVRGRRAVSDRERCLDLRVQQSRDHQPRSVREAGRQRQLVWPHHAVPDIDHGLVVDRWRCWRCQGAPWSSSGVAGSGTPLSSFASSVQGALGRSQGALSMIRLASSGGELNLEQAAIADATPAGTGTVDDVDVTYYDVTIDMTKLADNPDLSDVQHATIDGRVAAISSKVGTRARRNGSASTTWATSERSRRRTTSPTAARGRATPCCRTSAAPSSIRPTRIAPPVTDHPSCTPPIPTTTSRRRRRRLHRHRPRRARSHRRRPRSAPSTTAPPTSTSLSPPPSSTATTRP